MVCTEAETFGKPCRTGDAFACHVVENSDKDNNGQDADHNHGDEKQR